MVCLLSSCLQSLPEDNDVMEDDKWGTAASYAAEGVDWL
jgi:hypothetical protein